MFDNLLVRTAVVHHVAEQGADRYNDPERVETGTDTYPAWFDQSRSAEDLDRRDASSTDGLVVLPVGAVVGMLDWVDIDGTAYDIVGQPRRVWRGLGGGSEHHVECAVRVVTGR
jgi:hypothetical protein